jgi:hypothetical protein
MLPKAFFSSHLDSYKYTKKHFQIFFLNISLWNRSISTWEALIHSMLISEVNIIRNFFSGNYDIF